LLVKDYVIDPTEKLAIKICPFLDHFDGEFHLCITIDVPGGLIVTEPIFSREMYVNGVSNAEKEGLLSVGQAEWFNAQTEVTARLAETEVEHKDQRVRKHTGEKGKNPAGVELVGSDPDFYRFWNSTGEKSRSFCNLYHAMKSVAQMQADGSIPTLDEVQQIQDRIINLCLPVDIREAVSRRTGVPIDSLFVTGVEVRGYKVRLVPPCGAELPWLESREALRAMLRMFGPEAFKSGWREFDHGEQQINLASDLREDLTSKDRQDLDKFFQRLQEAKMGPFLGLIARIGFGF